MQKYKSHKMVEAFKIEQVIPRGDGTVSLLSRNDVTSVTEPWYARHKPEVDGYFVKYTDGYTSFSPAHAFEEGYTLMTEDHPNNNVIPSSSDDRVKNNTMRQNYRLLSVEEKNQMDTIKFSGQEFFEYLDSLGTSRELALAKTKIEEAVMWAVKHVTR